MKILNVAVAGAGNLGMKFVAVLLAKREALRFLHGCDFRLTAIADSSAFLTDPAGLPLDRLLAAKNRGTKLSEAWKPGGKEALDRRDLSSAEAREAFLEASRADVLLDLLPTNLITGEPGLSLATEALHRGMGVVFADKGPIVLKLDDLEALASEKSAKLGFQASCAGGLPLLSVLKRDLAGSEVLSLEAILNHTTNLMLCRMGQGASWDEAWCEALEVGHAETDPRLDTAGLDAAAKLVILARAALRHPCGLQDVAQTGINGIDPERIKAARRTGKELKLLARARKVEGGYALSVAPELLSPDHPLASIGPHGVAARIETDMSGCLTVEMEAEDSFPAARLLLSDLLDMLD